MHRSEWQWIVDLSRSGAESMEIDEALLQRTEESSKTNTILRFYPWKEPTVSLGKHQKLEESVELSYCRLHAIPVVRRPTGGRAVFHSEELTYALVSNDSRHFPLHSVQATYRTIAGALKRGLEQLGIVVELAGGARGESLRSLAPRKPCFVSASRCELLSQGRKITGSAQRRLSRSFLQHGSIPLRIDYPVMASALGVNEHLLKTTVISVSAAAGCEVSFHRCCEALRSGFEETFRVTLRCSPGVAFFQKGMLA